MSSKAVNANKSTSIHPKTVAPEEKPARNGKSMKEKRVQTRGAAKAPLRIPVGNSKEPTFGGRSKIQGIHFDRKYCE